MKKNILLVLAIVASTSYLQAQVILPTYAGDALRFSQTNYGSSARFKGMGNAQIGVGGDMSSIAGNPAGLGLFTKSEIAFTPEFNSTTIDGNYLNVNAKTNKSQINLNQFGAVFYMPAFKQKGQATDKGVVSSVIGLGYTRNNDYGLEANFSGKNTISSVYNMFDGDNAFTLGNDQAGTFNRKGAVSEFNIAGALNIANQVYIGGNIGLVNLNYHNSSKLMEDGIAENYSIDYYQNQQTKGSGLNARFGVIVRPTPEFRVGVNLQTPTWYNVDDSFSVSTNNNAISAKTYDFSYNLRTPLKGSLGASYILGARALVSADLDFIDYSSIHFSSSNGGDLDVINDNNNEIKSNYKSAINYRVGAEIKLDNFFSVRGGIGVNGSAYKIDKDEEFNTKFYSAGLGYRNNNYYVDLAYQRVEGVYTASPYLLDDYKEPVFDSTNKKNNIFLTVGLRF